MSARSDLAVDLARVPRKIPRVDYAITAGLLVWALLEAIFIEGPGTLPLRIALAFCFAVPMLFRRRWPAFALAAVAVTAALRGILGEVPEQGAMPFPSLLLGTFSAALYARPASLAIACLGLPVLAIVFGYSDSGTPEDYAVVSFIAAGAWTGGWLVRRRAAQVQRAYAESGELARSAVSEERARIARELHDVIAHCVSVIAVQAGAAEQQIGADPEKAREHLGAVRRTAREAMTEMRRLLGVLREDEASYIPQPGIARLPDLLEEARSGGLAVELSEEGARPQLSPGLDLTVYRLVQEALTNARKHAGSGEARVILRYGRRELVLEVSNRVNGPAAEARGGHGLVGMRERVRLFGGTFDAGRDDGSFHVRARLPLEEPGA